MFENLRLVINHCVGGGWGGWVGVCVFVHKCYKMSVMSMVSFYFGCANTNMAILFGLHRAG